MRARALRASFALLCAVSVLGSCASGATTTPPPDSPQSTTVSNPYEDGRRNGVEELLQKWADALRTNDVDALEQVVDPAADPEFLQAQVRRANDMAAVPFSDWGYELVDEPEIPVPSAIASPLNAADVWAPSVVLRYAVSGPDAESTRRPVSLVVARRDDEWRIVSDAPVPGTDRTTWRGPWDFGPVIARSVATAGGTSVVLGHPDQSALVDAVVAELPSAVDAVTSFYGDDWPQSALIFTSGSAAEFAASAGDATAESDVAAVTVSDAVRQDRPVTGQRVVFGPGAPARLTDVTTRTVLRHELTHVAARSDTVDGSPMWVLEGFADYSGYRESDIEFARIAPTLSAVVAQGGSPTVLPEDSDFSAGGVRTTLAYESAWSVFAFVAATFGEPSQRRLYMQLADGPKTAAETAGGVASALGIGMDEFVDQWGSWVLEQSR
ncbi:hypothetical protein CH293_21575 [Rhodococcus sp. 14-2470-1b]|uniref:hypothetical protein n=1 Tax=Rhodococcus sp. 14-2470-1b TaxID=2023149 RepID=UPI000B9AFAD4|nr:hypothetical protein [Rhodococcus sp. 14-2470-1b]OZF45548.1 hypothetical protein CH293_21575 [Rhodococcus sp. 14-2470-1b]